MPYKAIYVGQWDQQWDQQWALQSMCFVCACPVVSVTVLFQAGCSQHCPHSQHMCRFQKVNYFSLKTCLWQFPEINMHKTAQVQLFPQKHFQHTHTHISHYGASPCYPIDGTRESNSLWGVAKLEWVVLVDLDIFQWMARMDPMLCDAVQFLSFA